MRDAPDVDNLLATARDSLLTNILPTAAPAQKREVLMIANALAIARRSVAAGDTPLRAELAALRAIYPSPPTEAAGDQTLHAALLALNTRLVRDIRRGAFDAPGAARNAVEALIMESVIQKLRENRPKLVSAET